ncbi:MAG: hypothetical protein R3195_16650 [Gemmatimonadota bacterium]|nr:hypothetical protein [Gemmatimonadota bacterium]
MDTVQERLRYLRETVLGLSLREFRAAINARLDEAEALSLGTVSNYERPPDDGTRRAGPRAEFLAALKHAFPQIRLDWVLFGEGQATEVAERLAAPDGLERTGGSAFASQVLERHPDIGLLPPEGAALFMAALTRLAMGERDGKLDEHLLLELAGDLRWLLYLPARLWGFEEEPSYDVFSDYAVAMLHALMSLMPAPARGDLARDYAGSCGPELRGAFPVGFAS